MTEREMAQNNMILKYKTGSHLYGTNMPTSDEDFAGVFIANKEYYLGLKRVEEVDLSIVSKLDNGRNDSDAVDFKLYELRKFVQLALDNNPNIIEQLFVPNPLFQSELGTLLLLKAELFPHKGLTQKFIGYAKSQLHKMQVKPDNLKELFGFKNTYENFIVMQPNSLTRSKLTIGEYFEKFDHWSSVSEGNQFYQIGDLKFNPKVKMCDIYDSVITRLDKAGHRTDGMMEKGFDVKFGMHCIRLLFEGRELLETGKLEFPLKQRDLLLDIRHGKYEAAEIVKMTEDMTADLDMVCEKSYLPEKPDFFKIQKLLMNIVEESWK